MRVNSIKLFIQMYFFQIIMLCIAYCCAYVSAFIACLSCKTAQTYRD